MGACVYPQDKKKRSPDHPTDANANIRSGQQRVTQHEPSPTKLQTSKQSKSLVLQLNPEHPKNPRNSMPYQSDPQTKKIQGQPENPTPLNIQKKKEEEQNNKNKTTETPQSMVQLLNPIQSPKHPINPNPEAQSLVYQFQWNTKAPFAQFYQIDNKTGTLKYTASQLNRFQIYTKHPLPPKQNHSIAVEIVKQEPERAICFGFMTSDRLSQESSGDIGDKHSVGYWSYTSGKCQIDVENEALELKQKQSLGCAVGGLVELSLLLKDDYNMVRITRKENQKQEKFPNKYFQLPESFSGKDIYAFVSMIQKNDQIKTSYYPSKY